MALLLNLIWYNMVVKPEKGALEMEDLVCFPGLSTQPIWRKLWNDVMKTRPPKSEVSWKSVDELC